MGRREVDIVIKGRDQASKVFKKVGRSATDLKSTLTSITTALGPLGIGAAIAGAVTGGLITGLTDRLTTLTQQSFALIDSTGKVAAKLGLATEELTKLRLAARRSGVAVNTFDMALQRMIRRVSEAAVGTGEAQAALVELKLIAEDLNRLSPDEQFRMIADAMQGVPKQTDRVRLAFKLFDSEGVALVNTLNLGRKGLRDFGDEAERIGAVFSDETVKQITETNDAFASFKETLAGTGNIIAEEVAGPLTVLLDGLNQRLPGLIRQVAELKSVREFLREMGGGAAGEISRSGAGFWAPSSRIKLLEEQAKRIRPQIDPLQERRRAALRDIRELERTGFERGAELARRRAEAIWAKEFALRKKLERIERDIANWKRIQLDRTQEALAATKEALAATARAAKERRAEQLRSVDLLGLGKGKPHTTFVETMRRERADAEEQYLTDLRDFVKSISEETRTPMEQFREAYGQLVEALKKGMIGTRNFARGEALLTQRFMDMQEQTFNRLAPAVRGSPFVSGLTAAARQEQRPAEKINKKLDEVKREIRAGLDQINGTLSQGVPLTVGVFNN